MGDSNIGNRGVMEKRRDDELLGINLFAGDRDDLGARMRESRIVTTRKPQTCLFSERHEIPAGSRARVEKAIVLNRWCSFYVCCPCLTASLEEA